MVIASRRDLIRAASAGVPFDAAVLRKIDSVAGGVRSGTTGSFSQVPRTSGAPDALDVVIKALTERGIGEIEDAVRNTKDPNEFSTCMTFMRQAPA